MFYLAVDPSPPQGSAEHDNVGTAHSEEGEVHHKSCMSQNGVHHESGEMWHDGCRMCRCYHGKEMCSLVTCPQLKCDNPVYNAGDCCPSCPGEFSC